MPPTSAVPLVGFSRPHSMRIVVDLPAPFAPRKPKISPGADVEREVIDGGEIAEPARQAVDGDRIHRRLPADGACDARLGDAACGQRLGSSSSACSRATCASRTSALVATPARNRSLATRRASAAARIP